MQPTPSDKPILAPGQPTKEGFLTWRDNPVTQWAFRALQAAAEAQRQGWTKASWEEANPDPLLLTELRTRADAYLALEETEYDAFCAMNDQDPAAGEQDG